MRGALPVGCLPLQGSGWVTLTDGTGRNCIRKKSSTEHEGELFLVEVKIYKKFIFRC